MQTPFNGRRALGPAALVCFVACSSATESPPPEPLEPAAGAALSPAGDGPAAGFGFHHCPPGLGGHWACFGPARARCVDGFVQVEPCASGCSDPPGGVADAMCACDEPGLERWACGADGNLHACNGGGQMAVSCRGSGCVESPEGESDSCKGASPSLQATLDKLGPQCGEFSPGTDCGLSVRNLTTGEAANFRGNAFYAPASAVKALWVAAALHDAGVAKVEPFAAPVFVDSDNSAAGSVIDLLASPDRVNTFAWHDVGVADIGFCRWNFDRPRPASNCDEGPRGGSNFITSGDAVRFLSAVWGGRLLGAQKTQQLLDWMTLSPRQGYGGWLGTQLPEAARAAMYHKAGWLPPAEVPGNSNVNEIGIVKVPNGHAYAVALLLNGAPSQEAYDGLQLPTLEYASCVIYHAVAKDRHDPFAACVHP